jgi:pilus assembly protein Flp/PilA
MNMKKLYFAARRFWADEKGVTAIEYGLIAALIAVVLVAALGLVGGELENTFNFIIEKLQGARGVTQPAS